jgi:hypothetical protein
MTVSYLIPLHNKSCGLALGLRHAPDAAMYGGEISAGSGPAAAQEWLRAASPRQTR